MMNKVLGNLRQFSSVMGIILACSLIWFACSKIGLVNFWWRFTLVLMLLVITLIIVIACRWVIQKKGVKLHAELQGQKENLAGRQLEIAVLKEKMEEAVLALRTSELAVHYHGKAALYALPWYMVIGPAAAGKSTLLRNSGLHFSLASPEEIRVKGYGGTRNCDWWFADEAILLDTAGRYTTDEDDREEWQAFLQLIKKYRPRLPINGILIIISLVELLDADEEALQRHVKIIRERAAEIMHELHYLFPVTVVFTKMDLLPGFNSFFEGMRDEERQQVWGIYLADVTKPLIKAQVFKEKFLALYEKLAELRLSRVSQQTEIVRKVDLLDFPEQFLKCSERLSQFMGLLFKENPYQETPEFSGVYFTSAAQDNAVTPRGYFIQDLFSRVVFPYQSVTHKSRHYLHTLRWLKSGTVVAAMLVILTSIILYSTSLTANTLLVRRGAALAVNTVNALLQRNLSAQEKLIALNQLDSTLENLYGYRQAIPLHLRLGLYRGNALIPPLENILMQHLQHYFFLPTANYLEQQLMQEQQSWALATPEQDQAMRGEYYTTLKVYLMLCYPERMDADLATDVLAGAWSKQVGLPTSLLRSMVHFYITQPARQSFPVKPDLVQLSREQLYSPTNFTNLYSELKVKGLNKLGEVSVQELLVDNSAELVSEQRLPVLFTVKGWENYASPEINKIANNATRGDWVMGAFQPKASAWQISQITNQLTTLYFEDYSRAWLQFLQSIHLRSFASLDDAAKQLIIVADYHGPIATLLGVMYQNLTIANPILQNNFHALMPLIAPGKNGLSDQVENYLQQVAKVKTVMEKLAVSSDVGRDAQTVAVQLLSGNGNNSELYQASITANQMIAAIAQPELRQSLQTILLTPLRESWRLILREATLGLESQWQAEVVSVYQQSLANKFPFAVSGDDAQENDISRFFNPVNGILWQFVNHNLMPYLINTQNGWQERAWLSVGVGFSKEWLQSLSQAKIISDGFFADGNSDPKFTFEIYPEPTPHVQEIGLTTNGQTFRYRNDPQEWEKVQWPGNAPNDDTALTIVTAKDQTQGTIEINSIWGFFQLLQQASLLPDETGVLHATWKVTTDDEQHYRVSMLVRSQGSGNLFSNLLLNHFNLPSSLFVNN